MESQSPGRLCQEIPVLSAGGGVLRMLAAMDMHALYGAGLEGHLLSHNSFIKEMDSPAEESVIYDLRLQRSERS